MEKMALSIDIADVSNLFENSLGNYRIWRAKIVLFSSILTTAGVMDIGVLEYWVSGVRSPCVGSNYLKLFRQDEQDLHDILG